MFLKGKVNGMSFCFFFLSAEFQARGEGQGKGALLTLGKQASLSG